jgi:hypothetical protein
MLIEPARSAEELLTCDATNAWYTFRHVTSGVRTKAVPNHVESDGCCSLFLD